MNTTFQDFSGWALAQESTHKDDDSVIIWVEDTGDNLLPLDFIFDEIDHYQLRGLTAYALHNHSQYRDTLSVAGFFTLAAYAFLR